MFGGKSPEGNQPPSRGKVLTPLGHLECFLQCGESASGFPAIEGIDVFLTAMLEENLGHALLQLIEDANSLLGRQLLV